MTVAEQLKRFAAQGMTRTQAANALNIELRQLTELAAECGVTFRRRGEFELDGAWGTASEHAQRLGMSVSCLRWRLQNNKMRAPRKLPVTDAEVDQYIAKRLEGLPAWDAAAAVGRPYNTMHLAAGQRPEYRQLLADQAGTRRQRRRHYNTPIN